MFDTVRDLHVNARNSFFLRMSNQIFEPADIVNAIRHLMSKEACSNKMKTCSPIPGSKCTFSNLPQDKANPKEYPVRWRNRSSGGNRSVHYFGGPISSSA